MTSGSVIVTLSPDYLKTLAAGEHTLEIMFDDGASVTTTFTIKASSAVSTGEALTSTTAVVGSIMVIVAATLATVVTAKRIREERK